mmetsp:Transcript_3308/g.7289  ORF Transcript_3308/g.7289 Transcript_3308/m.7289 type:complete len:152 (-) Transcript_3308:561-1016(-)
MGAGSEGERMMCFDALRADEKGGKPLASVAPSTAEIFTCTSSAKFPSIASFANDASECKSGDLNDQSQKGNRCNRCGNLAKKRQHTLVAGNACFFGCITFIRFGVAAISLLSRERYVWRGYRTISIKVASGKIEGHVFRSQKEVIVNRGIR